MYDSLPTEASGLMNLKWADLESICDELITRNVSAQTVEQFLIDWTELSESIDEAYSRLYVATSVDTQDKVSEEKYHNFLDTIYPKIEEADQKLKTKLLNLNLEIPGFNVPLRKMRTEADLFRSENLPLLTAEHKLSTKYDQIIGAQTVEWEGKEIPAVQLRPEFQSTDRSRRETAWRTLVGRGLRDRQAIGDLWTQFMKIRRQLASNAGEGDYRSYRWKQMARFDYTPHDCKRFHEAIEQAVVPAATRIYEERKSTLGLSELRPWDLDVDPLGRSPLRPFKRVSELIDNVGTMFENLDDEFRAFFEIMSREGLLDLESRKNKAPGGYCTEFSKVRRPFIFMNAVGLHDDVQTLLHESGHAFHAFLRSELPFIQQRSVGMEFSEVASMAMELLAARYLERDYGGFYSEGEANRARIEHLEKSILFWPYMATVDAFQHWVYEHPDAAEDPSRCDEAWKIVSERFIKGISWSGQDEELKTGWQRKLHIHTVPFYYVEYGMAQLGSIQIWGRSIENPDSALKSYKAALSLGGTVSLPELFRAAGADWNFEPGALKKAVSLIETEIDRMKSSSK